MLSSAWANCLQPAQVLQNRDQVFGECAARDRGRGRLGLSNNGCSVREIRELALRRSRRRRSRPRRMIHYRACYWKINFSWRRAAPPAAESNKTCVSQTSRVKDLELMITNLYPLRSQAPCLHAFFHERTGG